MKKFMWKAFLKKAGGTKKFIFIIIVILITVFSTVKIIENIGVYIVFESIGISILYEEIKSLVQLITETNEKFSIDTDKKVKK